MGSSISHVEMVHFCLFQWGEPCQFPRLSPCPWNVCWLNLTKTTDGGVGGEQCAVPFIKIAVPTAYIFHSFYN